MMAELEADGEPPMLVEPEARNMNSQRAAAAKADAVH